MLWEFFSEYVLWRKAPSQILMKLVVFDEKKQFLMLTLTALYSVSRRPYVRLGAPIAVATSVTLWPIKLHRVISQKTVNSNFIVSNASNIFWHLSAQHWPPLWSSGQSFWLQIQRSRVRFPALPDFLSSSGSGTGSTQPREDQLRSYLNKKVAAPGLENRD